MAKWQDKAEAKIIKQETAYKKGYKILVALFEKSNVDFTKNFKVTNWNETDKKDFRKGMTLYGYEKLISKYE